MLPIIKREVETYLINAGLPVNSTSYPHFSVTGSPKQGWNAEYNIHLHRKPGESEIVISIDRVELSQLSYGDLSILRPLNTYIDQRENHVSRLINHHRKWHYFYHFPYMVNGASAIRFIAAADIALTEPMYIKKLQETMKTFRWNVKIPLVYADGEARIGEPPSIQMMNGGVIELFKSGFDPVTVAHGGYVLQPKTTQLLFPTYKTI